MDARNTDDVSTPDLTILHCPSCGAAEPVKASLLDSGTHMIRCRRCDESWPVRRSQGRALQTLHPKNQSIAWSKGYTLEAVRRPLVAYGDNHDPWAGKIEIGAPIPGKANPPRIWNMLAVMLALMFIGGFVASRQIAVAAVPDLASLYASVGLPVNLVGLELESVAGKRRFTGEGIHVAVAGLVANPGNEIKTIPELEITLLDNTGRIVASTGYRTPVAVLDPGKSVPFVVQIDSAPRGAVKVAVRFSNKPVQQDGDAVQQDM